MDKGRAVDDAYLDFRKALDTICHNILTSKLRKCRLNEWTVRWIEKWLNGRSQSVVTESSWEPVIKGVSQGSMLGPVLFNLFSSDSDKGQITDTDSTNLGAVADTPEGGVALQKDLNRVET